ncbi:hypothetical protein CR513_61184, partial [Mucuna pruriens]
MRSSFIGSTSTFTSTSPLFVLWRLVDRVDASLESEEWPCITRSSSNNLHAFDPEIDRTLHSSFHINSESNIIVNMSHELDPMENNDRTLKELAMLNVLYQPWRIQYPQLEPAQSYELKSELIHLLPKFHGLIGEDPHKHLKEFHMVAWDTGGLHQMKTFMFYLDGTTKDWLYLQPVLFNTWGT